MQKVNKNTLLLVIALLVGLSLFIAITNFFAVKLLILLLLIAAGYVAYTMQQKKTQKLLSEQNALYQLKMDMIRSSLDPHFLFNALNSISFSMHKDDIDSASANLGKLSKFLRTSLNDFNKFSHELNEEVEFIKNYLALEKFRFKEQFTYTIKVMPYVNDMTKVPAFLLFCFVENALKKGVLSKQGGGQITITIDENPSTKYLIITIADNGFYRDLTNIDNFTHNIKVTNTLVDKLNTINREKIKIDYSSNGNINGELFGSKVQITIPHELNCSLLSNLS